MAGAQGARALMALAFETTYATPGVRRVLPDMPPVMFPVWLTTNREVGMSRRVRFVFDLIAEEFDKG